VRPFVKLTHPLAFAISAHFAQLQLAAQRRPPHTNKFAQRVFREPGTGGRGRSQRVSPK
jgi:hypothetical protein